MAHDDDVRAWEQALAEAGDDALAQIADWGPTEDWSDWAATGC